jgi:hypothetical protein
VDGDCSTATVTITIVPVNDPPVAGTATAPVQINPMGTVSVSVGTALFSGTDVDGTISTLTITSFPTNATSITIDGTPYTAGTFPAGGVTVFTTANGESTVPVSVDPVNGDVTVVISYQVTDNDGLVSSNTGTVSLPFVVVPDVTPNITATPNIMYGTTSFNLTIAVTELNSKNTNGLITVIIPKDSRLTFTYDGTLTELGFTSLENSKWTYSNANAFYHIFTTTDVIPANGVSTFGMRATFAPGSTRGKYTITSTIVSGSGGENRTNNNVDAETLDYFAN